jgi:tellurite resistance protein TehA-like permease
MERTQIVLAVGAIAAVLFQVWVSVQLLRSTLYEPSQKRLQMLVVWLIPVIGAVIVQSMMRSDGKPPYRPEKGYTEPGDHAS